MWIKGCVMAKNNVFKSLYKGWFEILIFILLTLFTLILVALLIFAILTSLKSNIDFMDNVVGIPKQWKFGNYVDIVNNFSFYVYKNVFINGEKYIVETKVGLFPELVYNTLIYTIGGSFVSTLAPCLMAYVTAKFSRWRISRIVFTTVIVTMIIQPIGTASASIAVVKATGIYDQLWGNMIQKFHFTGLYFLIFHSSFKMLAKDYSDAAYLDGASEWKVFFYIIFPLVVNIFGTVMLIKFIEFWNDYSTVLIYLPTHPTLAYGIYKMSNTTITGLSDGPHRIAGALLLFIPTMTMFIIFNKKLLGNLSMGGVKE